MELYRLKACAKCGGDLAYDEGDWICLQCGTYYYVDHYLNRTRSRRRPGCHERLAKGVGMASTSPSPPEWGDAHISPWPASTVVSAAMSMPGRITR